MPCKACSQAAFSSAPLACYQASLRACAGGGGGGYGGGGGGFSARIAPDREATQGTVARPGRATRLPTAEETERQLDEVMATVPDELKARAAAACWHRVQGVGLSLIGAADCRATMREKLVVFPASSLLQVPAHYYTLKHSASYGS